MTTVTLDAATYATLARRAADRGVTIEQFLAEQFPAAPPPTDAADDAPPPPGESAYDAFMRVGAIGCVTGGPPDVATNPKYMEDFGKPLPNPYWANRPSEDPP